MRRFLNVIVSTVLAAVLIVSSVVPAMAAEQDAAVSESSVVSTAIQNDATSRVSGNIETRSDKNIPDVAIYPGSYVGDIEITESHYRTVTINVTGISGIVIFRFTNRSTGDSRSFTAIGGQIHSLTYVSPLDKGWWDIEVVNSDNTAYGCNVYFRAH